MNRKTQVILIGAVGSMAIAAAVWLCMVGRKVPSADAGGRMVTDPTGRQVRLPEKPSRILSLCTSVGETIVALGQQDRLAGIDEYSRVVPGLEKTPVLGKGSALSREHILAMKIDLAFAWWYQNDAVAMLEGLGVPVVRIANPRAREVADMIRLVGDCLGCAAEAQSLAATMERSVLDATSSRTRGPGRLNVYLELYSPFKTVGAGSYADDLLELAGVSNIARDSGSSTLLSAERLIQADPDVVCLIEGFCDAGAFASRPGMADLRAVRKGRVVLIDRRLLVAGPRLPESIRKFKTLLLDGQP